MARPRVVPAGQSCWLTVRARVPGLNSPDTWIGVVSRSTTFGTLVTCLDYLIWALWLSPALHPGRQHKLPCCNWIVLFGFFVVFSLLERLSLGRSQIKALASELVFNWFHMCFLDFTVLPGWAVPRKYLDFDVWLTPKDRAAGPS